VDFVVNTERCTTLGKGDVVIHTVEHILGTLFGLGIDNAEIRLNGPEVPIFDGSAAEFARMLLECSIVQQDAPKKYFKIPSRIQITDEPRGAELTVWPDEKFSAVVTIDFNSPAVPTQSAFHRN